MTTYRILEPDEWGMRWARPPVAERLLDPETYIHHRGGNPAHKTDAAVAFRELNEWTINVKGYSATDYDILVHENTLTDTVTIGVARGQWMSAATKDRNEDGEAICALGFFHPGHSLSERPSPRMLEGLARAVVLSIERGWSAPDTKILGHRDNPMHPGATPCPGDYLYAELPKIRNRVATLLAPPEPAPLPPPPEPEDHSMNTPIIRVEGYADQFLCIPLSAETKARLQPSTEQAAPVVLAAKDRAAFLHRVGYPLTPMAGE